MLDELKLKTKNYETELKSLSETLTKTRVDLDETKGLNKDLNEFKAKMETDYGSLKKVSDKQVIRIGELESELESARVLYESTSKDSQLELKVRLEKLSKDLNSKWQETLR